MKKKLKELLLKGTGFDISVEEIKEIFGNYGEMVKSQERKDIYFMEYSWYCLHYDTKERKIDRITFLKDKTVTLDDPLYTFSWDSGDLEILLYSLFEINTIMEYTSILVDLLMELQSKVKEEISKEELEELIKYNFVEDDVIDLTDLSFRCYDVKLTGMKANAIFNDKQKAAIIDNSLQEAKFIDNYGQENKEVIKF